MSEEFIASVQYGDFKGTIAMDGHESGFLQELAAQATEMPEGYWPVGFEMWNPYKLDEEGSIPLTIVAARCADVGESFEEMNAYHQKHGELPVYRFCSKINFAELISLMKRLDIKAVAKPFRDMNVVVQNSLDLVVRDFTWTRNIAEIACSKRLGQTGGKEDEPRLWVAKMLLVRL